MDPPTLVQGTTDLLILNIMSSEPKHGWAIAKRIQQISGEQLQMPQGFLYPALHRLEGQRLIAAEWRQSPSGRHAKFYALTPAGRRVQYHSRSKNQGGRAHLCGTATAVAFSMAATAAAAAQETGTLPHVRSSSPFLRELFAHGAAQSPTFRTLLEAIGNTNGIVYIENGRCGHSVHNCLLMSVIPAGGFRYLKIVVDADRVHGQNSELIASMGHELRHALEVLAESRVRSTMDMFSLYANQTGLPNGHFETPAAVRAGDQVLAELSRATPRSRTRATADIALTIDTPRSIVDSQGIRHGQTQ